jgi:uncharacterized protein (TIGR02270 family)
MTGTGGATTSEPPALRWDLVEECLDEAGFLWRHRKKALSAHDRDLCNVARIEERLLGCIDGLHVGGMRAVRHLLMPALGGTEAARVSVAAYALAAEGGPFAWDVLIAELSAADDERAETIGRGLQLVESSDLLPRVEGAAELASPAALATAIEIRAHRRLDAGYRARELMASGHVRLQRAVVRAARHGARDDGGRKESQRLIEIGLAQPSSVRDAALESGLIVGHHAAAACCSEAIARLPDDGAHLLLLAAVARPDEERQNLLAALDRDPLAASAVWALGFAGTRWAADACLDLMRQGRHSVQAREAFRAITGMPLARAPSAMAMSTTDEAGEADDEEPATIAPGEVDAVERWWSRQRASHDPAVRHIRGRPVDCVVLAQALLTENMQRRPGIALELAVLSQGERQLETRAWCREQRREATRWLGTDVPCQRDGSSHAGPR